MKHLFIRRTVSTLQQRWAALLMIGIGIGLCCGAGATQPAGADWPQFLGPTRDGVYRGEEIAAAWPAGGQGGPRVLWTKDVGQGFSGPVVSGGKLIVFHRLADKEMVECFDARSGQSAWSAGYPTGYVDDFGFDEGPRATPAVADGRAFTFGAEGALNAWEMAAGKNLWSVDTKAAFGWEKGYFGAACSPLVEGDAVIVNLGGKGGAGVVAFEKTSGKVLWKATNDAASYASPVAATIGGARYVLAFTRAGLVAMDPASGRVFFQFPWRARIAASVNAATPLVIDDMVFLSASYGTGATLLKFQPQGPQKLWASDEVLSNHYATSVYAGGFLYGFHGRQEQGPDLRCVELKTGKVRWSEEHFGAGTILLAGDRLLILTEQGQLVNAPATPDGFKAEGKAQILGGECRAYPALAGGLLYARAKNKLVCVDLRKAD